MNTLEGRRDRGIDGLRVVALAGVVVGHWLVTALVLGPDGALTQDSPLRTVPALVPASWLLQTLGLFFFVAGFAASRSWTAVRTAGGTYGRWLTARLGRLGRPVAAFVAVWAFALAVALVAGAPDATLETVVVLVISPLWFLAVLIGLCVATAPVGRAVRRFGPLAALPLAAVVAVADAGWGQASVTLLAAWTVPYLLGVALAEGRLGRRSGRMLALGGTATLVVLLALGDYPTAAVGVPGAGGSNLNPPTLPTVALAAAQSGLAVLCGPKLDRLLGRPGRWRPVAAVNRMALPVFLAHQSSLIMVTVTLTWLSWGTPLPGLHTTPGDAGWLVTRVAWLPVFVAGLLLLVALFPTRARGPNLTQYPAGERDRHGWTRLLIGTSAAAPPHHHQRRPGHASPAPRHTYCCPPQRSSSPP
ncbi:acyltransferase [Plantactinospora sp. GCM10030261]|uniref:acyltransferase family protein n=1 Tax=Plantactinospora sp. GCM10030261 TaxID=3273420 RepID=UPI0036152CF1